MTAPQVLQHVGVAALEGSLALLIVASVTRAFPRLPAAVRAALWLLVSAKFVLALAPHVPLKVIPTPSSLEPTRVWVQAGNVVRGAIESTESGALAARTAGTVARALPWNSPESDLVASFALLLVALWAFGCAVWMLRAWREHQRLRVVWSAAEPLEPAEIAALAGQAFTAGAFRARPEVRMSAAYAVPLTFGWRRSCILLPISTARGNGETARLALVHELAHVRRHDLLFGWIPALAQALFWFHPPVAWCAREYAQAREEACDAEVLRLTGAPPRVYGELLLRYGISDVLPTTAVASCASRTSRALSRRLQMIGNPTKPSLVVRIAAVLALLIAAVAAIPVRVIARPGTVTTSRTEVVHNGMVVERDASHEEEDFSYIFVQKNSDATRGVLDLKDLPVLKRVRESLTSDVLLVRLGRSSYTISDESVRKRAAELVAPLDAIDRRRAPFEKRMKELSVQITELEAELEPARSLLDRLEQQVAKLESAVDKLRDEGRDTESLRRQKSRVESKRDAAREMVEELGGMQDDLTQQIDTEQSKCDSLCSESDSAQSQMIESMRALVTEAVAKGLATPIR